MLSAAPAPGDLICELMSRPELAAIHTARPRFGWVVNDTTRGAMQAAYQLVVTGGQGPAWDSGRVESGRSIDVAYAGAPLLPRSSYSWKVRTWSSDGACSAWSQEQPFRTGNAAPGYAPPDPLPLQCIEVPPVSLVRLGDGHYFADFGRAAFGTLTVSVDAPPAGRAINVHMGEMADGTNRVQRRPPGTIRYRMAELPLDRGAGSYRVVIPPDKRNTGPAAIRMPAGIGEVLPFRYCELENCPSPLQPEQVRQIAVHHPFNDSASSFRSSNETLNDVWELCKYTIKATSFCGIYVDGDRERIPYEADAYINQLCHYCVDRDYTMARRTHEYLLANPTWPTEWILHSVLMAWADYEYTGDARPLEAHYGLLAKKTLSDLALPSGLISTAGGRVTDTIMDSVNYGPEQRAFNKNGIRDIVDWPPGSFTEGGVGERDGYVMTPVNTVVNAFHYRTLVLMERIAAALGRNADAREWHGRAERVRDAVNTLLFDETRGVYLDGAETAHASLHANMFPLAFGMVPAKHRADVVEFIRSRGMACSVYGAQFLLEALYEAGEAQYALELMTSAGDRGWVNMMRVGSTMTLEAWDLRYKKNLDWNHAWGAAPANIIPRYLVGIRPLEPGFRRVLIQPQPGNLEEADAVHPTIRGPVKVGFRNRKDTFELTVDIPGNTTADVVLPYGGIVELDGKTADATQPDGKARLSGVRPGQHTVRVTRPQHPE